MLRRPVMASSTVIMGGSPGAAGLGLLWNLATAYFRRSNRRPPTMPTAQSPEETPMPFDPKAADLTVGVVGTGSMGRGIMQVSAQGGMRVVAYDEKPGAAQAAKDYIAKMLDGAGARRAACRPTRPRPRSTASSSPRASTEVAQGQPHHRGHHRAPRRQAGAVRQARRAGRPRHHHRLQHLLAPDHGDRLRLQASRARRRHALLQSGAADAAGRDHPRPQDRAVGDGGHDDASAGA